MRSRHLAEDGLRESVSSAQIDAVLRTGALSDAFTQDLEDHQEPEGATVRQQKQRIVALLTQVQGVRLNHTIFAREERPARR
jgi:hypothetical protein